MAIQNRRALKQTADARLGAAAYDPKKLALIHTAAALGVSLVITLIDFLLARQIGTTGGLSGLGMRSILETVRTVLQYAGTIALPFWEFGFLFAAIRMARGETARPALLLEGFRRFGPVLRLQLLRGMLYFGIMMVCVYFSSFVYSMTPLAEPLLELMMSAGSTIEEMQAAMWEIPMETLLQAMWPVLAISGALSVAVLIPLHYRLRLADFIIMDQPGTGALMAMISSIRIMRKNCVKWFRLELSFWWFYVLVGLSVLVSYGDALLPLLGIPSPMSSDTAWLVFYILGILVQLALYWQAQSRVQTTYAVAYDILRQQEPYTPPEKPVPQNLPWDDYQAQ